MQTSLQIYSPENGKNTTIGWLVSIAFHVILLLLFFFAMAWEKQNPPIMENVYGVEVNFGTSDQGFGEEQNFTPPGPDPAPEKTEITPSNPVEETTTAPQTEQAEPEKVITGDDESVAVAPEPKPKKVVEAETTPAKITPVKPTAQSLFPSEKTSPSNNNNGNKPGTVGDMGVKGGNPDARGIYEGNPGKGKGGPSLDMSGWKWDSKPTINDESTEEGRIVFQIKVDEEGNIIAVNVLEKNVSPAVVKKYQKEVESLSFSRTSGGNSGEGATGRITFIITSR